MKMTDDVKVMGKLLFCIFLTFNLFFIISLAYDLTPRVYAISDTSAAGDSVEARIIAEELARQKKAEKKSLVNDLFDQAKREYDAKNYETSQQLFERVVQLDPKNKAASRYIEMCKEAMNKEVPETVTGSMIKRGKDNYRDKQYSAAVADFESALASNPNDAEAQAWLIKARSAEALQGKEKATKEERKWVVEERKVAKEEKDTAEQSALLDVDKGWLPPERHPKEEMQVEEVISEAERAEKEARAQLLTKMQSVIVPAISVTDADVQDLIRQLMEMTGVTIVVNEKALADLTKEQPIKISLSTATPMPLLDVLDIAFKTTQLGYKVEPNYVWVSKKSDVEQEELVTRTYKLKYGERKTREVKLREFESTTPEKEK